MLALQLVPQPWRHVHLILTFCSGLFCVNTMQHKVHISIITLSYPLQNGMDDIVAAELHFAHSQMIKDMDQVSYMARHKVDRQHSMLKHKVNSKASKDVLLYCHSPHQGKPSKSCEPVLTNFVIITPKP